MLATSPSLLAGTTMATMMLTWLHQDSMMGATYVDMVTASNPYGSGPPHSYPQGCHGVGVQD